MIITNNDQKTVAKGPGPTTRLLPPRPPSPFDAAPTATAPPPPYHSSDDEESSLRHKRSGRAFRRFIRAFAIAALVWLLVALILGSIIGMIRSSRGRRWRPPPEWDRGDWGVPSYDKNVDGSKVSCKPNLVTEDPPHDHPWQRPPPTRFDSSFPPIYPNYPSSPPGPRGDHRGPPHDHPHNGSHPDRIFTAKFIAPSTESLYFLTRGVHSNGQLIFEPAPDASHVVIEVKTRAPHVWNWPHIDLCTLSRRNDKSRGFGIFTPSDRWDWMPEERRSIRFNITVYVPVGERQSSMFKSLQSDMPDFSHHFGTFAPGKSFDSIDVKGRGDITAESLEVQNGRFTTANANIDGHYIAHQSLELATTDAPITANIDMFSLPESPYTSTLSLSTTNRLIKATVRQATTTPQDHSFPGAGGNFSTSAITTNGAIVLTVSSSPVFSQHLLQATANNGGASISLYRAWEGAFSLSSTNGGTPLVMQYPLLSDPAGKGRSPSLKKKTVESGIVAGEFYWSSSRKKNEGRSQAIVKTTNGAVVFNIV